MTCDVHDTPQIQSQYNMTESKLRKPTASEISILQSHGCRATDWDRVKISDNTRLDLIYNVHFVGDVSVGALDSVSDSCIENCRIENCEIGDDCRIRNIGDTLRNCRIGNGVTIVNTGRIEFEPDATCGVGTHVNVLDETGSRAVTIYPGMSAHAAMLMARDPDWRETHFLPMLHEWIRQHPAPHRIGDRAVIRGVGTMLNVSVDREVTVKGALSLVNGSIVNNAPDGECLAYVGYGVDARDFIVEDGVVDSSAIIRNCYIGQGAVVESGFSAHDSLFFANSKMANGEACALFAGPYTISMHKSSLLIACQTSFMNAGSGTNQSNHMYKLGPIHWGVMERGVKTSSGSYMMFGAKIGAFSLLMGQHKTHPDTSQFPFSYLFGDSRGTTQVVPAMMLPSCGLQRDEKKWPNRDIRDKHHLPKHDRVIFDVLNPLTVGRMLGATTLIDTLLENASDNNPVLYHGLKFSNSSLTRGRQIYEWSIFKYLSLHMDDGFPASGKSTESEEWIDLAGLLMRRDYLKRAMEAGSIPEMEKVFGEAFDNYRSLERQWIADSFSAEWLKNSDAIRANASRFDSMVEQDRCRALSDIGTHDKMLAPI